jgi:O-antigen/teichoic acid export membrane protein
MKNMIAFFLRGSSAFARLVFVIYLGANYPPSLVGDYGLLVTLTVVFSQLAGLEIHQLVVRDLHRLNELGLKKLMSRQLISNAGAYAILISILTWIYQDWLGNYWILVGLILIADHYTTELYRYNVAKLNTIKATSLLALKNIGWVVCLLALDMLGLYSLSMISILATWSIFLIFSVIIGTPNLSIINYILQSKMWRAEIIASFGVAWKSRYFMISAAAITMIVALDKFFIELNYSKEDFGLYFFTYSIASVPALIVSFTVGLTVWPKCIKLRGEGRFHEYESNWSKLGLLYLLIIIGLSFAIYFGALFFDFNLKDSFNLNLLGLLLVVSGAMALIEPLKLRLYLEGLDLNLALMNVFHLVVVILSILVFYKSGDVKSVAVGLIIANLIALLAYFKNMPNRLA